MNDELIKNGIEDFKRRIQELELKVAIIEREKVDIGTLHKIEMDIQKINNILEETGRNRIEDREEMKRMNDSITKLEEVLQTYVAQNTEILIGQKQIIESQAEQNKVFNLWLEAENRKPLNVYKTWSSKNKWTKLMSLFINIIFFAFFIVFVFEVYTNGMNGGIDNPNSGWDKLIQLITAIRGS